MNKQVTSSGMSLSTVLFVVFLTLRLTNNIDWAWYWVASPLWIPLAGVLVAITAFLMLAGLCKAIIWPFVAWEDWSKARKRRGIAKVVKEGKL